MVCALGGSSGVSTLLVVAQIEDDVFISTAIVCSTRFGWHAILEAWTYLCRSV